MADLQVLRKTSVTVTETFTNENGPIDLDVAPPTGVPTVVATAPDGTTSTLTASGVWTGRTTGQFRVVLPAQPEVTWRDLTWTGTIGGQPQTLESRVEWLGALLFTLDAFRKLRVAGSQPFQNTATYPNEQITATRAALLDEFQEILQFSPVPRFRRQTFNGTSGTSICLPGLFAHRILSVTVNGVAQSAAGYQVGEGNTIEAVSSYSWGTAFTGGRRNVTVEWVEGWERPKGLCSQAAMVMAAATLNPSGFSSATTVSLPTGETYTYEPAEQGRGGFDRHTGVRELDRWLNRWAGSRAAIA